MMTRMTGPTGLIPEQVWDGLPLPARGLEPGKPTGGAMPLVWAHAEFLKLLRTRQEKRPIELLNSVEKHFRRKVADVGTWHWRTDTPFDALPAHRDLLVEMESPFVLLWASTGGKPSRTGHRPPLRSAGTECVSERTSSLATECSISPDILSAT